MDTSLILPAFIAGLITFLAPCTLPLVPAYLGFISGVAPEDLQHPASVRGARQRIFLNGLFFVFGFMFVFILFGTLAGFLGSAFVPARLWLARLGGFFVIFFGLMMLGTFRLPALSKEYRPTPHRLFSRGTPASSLAIGGAFAFGWSPCVGPILGSILLFAGTTGTAVEGAFLLAIFSLGLAIPFLLVALGVSSASQAINRFFALLNKLRAPILACAGLLIGFLVNIAVLAIGIFLERTVGVSYGLVSTSAWLLSNVPYAVPLCIAILLGTYAYRHPRIDVFSTIGGLSLIPLGILLATNNFNLVIQYSYEILNFLHYESLLDYL